MNAAEIIKKDLDAIYIGNLSTVFRFFHFQSNHDIFA